MKRELDVLIVEEKMGGNVALSLKKRERERGKLLKFTRKNRTITRDYPWGKKWNLTRLKVMVKTKSTRKN